MEDLLAGTSGGATKNQPGTQPLAVESRATPGTQPVPVGNLVGGAGGGGKGVSTEDEDALCTGTDVDVTAGGTAGAATRRVPGTPALTPLADQMCTTDVTISLTNRARLSSLGRRSLWLRRSHGAKITVLITVLKIFALRRKTTFPSQDLTSPVGIASSFSPILFLRHETAHSA